GDPVRGAFALPPVEAAGDQWHAATLSACGEPRNRWRNALEGANLGEPAVRADAPAVHLLRIGVERVEEAAVRADRLVADSRLAEPRRCRDRLGEFDATVVVDAVARDRAVAEVSDVDEAAVLRHGCPADLAAGVADGAADGLQLARRGDRVRGRGGLSDVAAERFGDDEGAALGEAEAVGGLASRGDGRRAVRVATLVDRVGADAVRATLGDDECLAVR